MREALNWEYKEIVCMPGHLVVNEAGDATERYSHVPRMQPSPSFTTKSVCSLTKFGDSCRFGLKYRSHPAG